MVKVKEFLLYFCRSLKGMFDQDFRRLIIGEGKYDLFSIKSYGNQNNGKLIYLLEIDDSVCGFFALYRYLLMGLYCCDRFGFVPYISLINTHYNNKGHEKDNMFEYYYKQPFEIDKKEVYQSRNVIPFNRTHMKWFDKAFGNQNSILLAGYDINTEYIKSLACIRKKYINYQESIKRRLENDVKGLISNRSCVAIHYRGNAYNVGFFGHPIPLTIEDYIPYIEECMENGYDSIFLATDDEVFVNAIKKRYENRVLFYDDTIRSNDGVDVHDKADNQGFEIGYQVLRDMYTMSCCSALICGISQVTIATMVEKESSETKFEYMKVISKGMNMKNNGRKIRKYYKSVKSEEKKESEIKHRKNDKK